MLKDLVAAQRAALPSEVVPAREYLASISPLLAQQDKDPRLAISPGKRAPQDEQQQGELQVVLADADAALIDKYPKSPPNRLRVTEALELALRVLEKNAKLGGTLTTHDRDIIARISALATASPTAEATRAAEQRAIGEQAASFSPDAADAAMGVEDVPVPL